MSFDTSYQNTGLLQRAKGGFAPCRSATEVSEQVATPSPLDPSWGFAPNPTLAVWQEGKATRLSLCEGSVSLRSVKGRVVFSAKISTLKPLTALSLYVSKNVEIYRLTGRSPATVPRGGWGCRGQSPLHSPPFIMEPV